MTTADEAVHRAVASIESTVALPRKNGELLFDAPWQARVLGMALAIEAGWEVFENTDFIINRYREDTAALDYFGDSVVNSVGDYVAAAAGFLLAARLPLFASIAAVLLLEGVPAVVIRDNLALNIIMLIHPVDAIRDWQLSGMRPPPG